MKTMQKGGKMSSKYKGMSSKKMTSGSSVGISDLKRRGSTSNRKGRGASRTGKVNKL